MKNEDEDRRWHTVAVTKNPEVGRDRVRELLADGREFFDCIGAATREDDPRFPVGADVLYALPLTAGEAADLERNGEGTGEGNNVRSVDLSVPTEAHAAPTPIPAEATLRYLRADAASIDANVWHGRDVAAAVLDQGTTQAVRDRMGFTLVDRKNFGDPVAAGDELLRSPTPTTENEGFHDHGCLVAPNLIPVGGRLLDALVVTANGNSSAAMFAAAVRWACDQGAKVINYSFGVIGGESQAYVDALTYARDAGVEVFISAGNDGQNTLAAPASYARTFANVHAIISYDEATNARAPSSNYTFDASGCAPGVGVVSLTPSAAVRTWQGTSCAGPCAASDVVRGCTGGRFSPRQVGAALKANLRDTGQLPIYQGGGAYDLRRALVALGAVTAPGTRRNPSPNPTLEVSGLSGHAAGSNTPAPTLVTSGGRTSAAYGQVTATGSVVQIYGPSSPVVPGGVYCPSVFVRRNRATPPYLWSRAYMQWLTSAGAHISFTSPPYVFSPPDADAWHRVTSVDAVAPAGAALARPMLYIVDAVANEVIGFDGWMPEPTSIGIEPYFDGSFPNAAWTGAEHASPSLLAYPATPGGTARPRAAGQPAETDTARPVGRTRRRGAGQASSPETATPVVRARRRDIGQAVDLELATPVSARRPGEARKGAEVDTASPVGRSRRLGVGQAAPEVDSTTALGRLRRRLVAFVADVESATQLVRLRRRDVAVAAAETDTARPVGRAHARRLTEPAETDTAQTLARRRRRSIGQALDTSSATAIRRKRRRALDVGVEYDIAAQLGESTTRVTDADYAAALKSRRRRPFGTLRVDWSGTGTLPSSPTDPGYLDAMISSIEVERALDGDLPAGAGEIDGYATGKLQADLGGRPRRDPDAATVNAATKRLAEVLSPFRADSPLAGKRKTVRTVAAELGVVTSAGPRSDRVFTGQTEDVDLDEGAATVKIDATDPSERLRALITLPTYGEFVTHVAERQQGNPARGWQFTVNTQLVIDMCLRRNGINVSPPFRAESIIGCTGHGGLVSEIGFNGAPISRGRVATRPKSIHTEDGNPWGMLASPEGSEASYQEFYGFTSANAKTPPIGFYAGQGGGVSGWLHLSSLVGGSASVEKVIWQLWPTRTKEPRLFVHGFGDGTIAAGLFDQNAYKVMTPRISLGSAPWNFVGVHFRWTDDSTLGVVVRTRAWDAANGRPAPAGTTRTYSLTGAKVTVTPTPFYDGYRPILQCRAYMWRAWMLLQAWPGFTPPSTNSATPWRGEEWVSQADLGRGNNELAYLPDVAAAESWDILKAAVESEYGVHGFNEYGRYYFRPRTDTRADRIDHVLDIATNLAEVAYTLSSDTIRNSIGVTTKPAYHVGKIETVVKADADDQFIVPGNANRVFELDWPHGAAGWQGGTLPYCYQDGAATASRDAGNGFAKWSGDIAHGWTYSSRGASGGWTILDNTRSVVVDFVQVSARKVWINVQNNGSGEIRLATAAKVDDPDAGEPALRIGGWPLASAVDKVTTYRNDASIAALGGIDGGGERSLPLASSEWRQYEPALRPIAEALLAALADEVPTLDDLPVRGDPTIRVGNVARCVFRDDVEVIGTVVKTRHRLSVGDGKLSTSVSVRPLPVSRQPVVVEGSDLAPPGWLFYVDISRYQEGMDLARVADVGYAGCVAKVGQGASSSQGYVASLDPQWATFRDAGRVVWPDTFAGYWYVGDGEAAADQASRCKAALGDVSIPVMLDWEAGGGSWTNLLAVLSAFRSAGLFVTMLYTNLQGYGPSNGATNIDSATGGLSLINSRYWVARTTNAAQDPRTVFDDMQANRPGFGFGTVLGGTVDALQFSDAGVVYPGGPAIDINAFPGAAAQLAAMFNGS